MLKRRGAFFKHLNEAKVGTFRTANVTANFNVRKMFVRCRDVKHKDKTTRRQNSFQGNLRARRFLPEDIDDYSLSPPNNSQNLDNRAYNFGDTHTQYGGPLPNFHSRQPSFPLRIV